MDDTTQQLGALGIQTQEQLAAVMELMGHRVREVPTTPQPQPAQQLSNRPHVTFHQMLANKILNRV